MRFLAKALVQQYSTKSFLESLQGKVVWITGASYGIGAFAAYEAAANGAKLIISARSKDKLDQVKRECLSKF